MPCECPAVVQGPDDAHAALFEVGEEGRQVEAELVQIMQMYNIRRKGAKVSHKLARAAAGIEAVATQK